VNDTIKGKLLNNTALKTTEKFDTES